MEESPPPTTSDNRAHISASEATRGARERPVPKARAARKKKKKGDKKRGDKKSKPFLLLSLSFSPPRRNLEGRQREERYQKG